MKRKKLFSKTGLVLVASAFLFASGCSSSDVNGSNDSNGSNNSADEEVVVDVFQSKVEFKDEFDELVEKYEEENPNVTINFKAVGGGTDYAQALKSVFSSNDEPDIFSVGGPAEVEQYRTYLADLSDTDSAKAALKGTLDGVTDGEEVLGLPYNQEGYGLLYNKALFEQAGINPDEIITHEDLEKAVTKLDSQKEDLNIDAVFALAAKETWVIGMHLANTYLAPEFNNNAITAYNADTVTFEKGDEMKRFLDLQAKYSVQPVLSLDYSQQVEELFSLQRVAMIKQGNWVYNAIHEMDPEFAENNVGIMPMPVEGYEQSIPVGVPSYWGVNKQSDEKVVQAAKDFLDYLNTSEVGKETILNDFNFIPAYEGYDTSKIVDPISKGIYDYASEGKTIGWTFSGYPTGWSVNNLAVHMQEYLAGEKTWDEVVEDSIEDWEEARQE
ncbi:ABC transporter substrate-binding protein [Paraliobacillus quinghaiensis]|uniref:ABC transporter substrate-binding protein n=1 Tax=Paraliobacillus quinghaiensis TaxID=470815 RepID=A0A917TE81_9BACI|nr:ABC transporter substrate-binding protein [Paraliobacillus quinghaiensis]GGM19568.1 ABC transporter substrate-binding protein [Paraliobacillus quinghaiensis]